MNHVSLDLQAENVRDFLLNLASDRAGTTLESNGHPVACVVPIPLRKTDSSEAWTKEKNDRRCLLIDRKYQGGLTAEEIVELEGLQDEMLRFRRKVAPLPIEYARQLHQELLEKAAKSTTPR